MKHYIIYTYLKTDYFLHPNFIVANGIDEALEILCASKNCQKEFMIESNLSLDELDSLQNDSNYVYIDSTNLGGEKGYLLKKHMIVKERGEDFKWQISACTV